MKIGCIIPATSKNRQWNSIEESYLYTTTLKTFVITYNKEHTYTFYIGIDTGDLIYDNTENKQKLEHFCKIMRNIDIKFICMDGIAKGHVTIMWNRLFEKAYSDGCDYFFQCGDDIEFKTKDWVNDCIETLQKSENIGLVGPINNNPRLLTQSFVSRKHMEFFGYYFPPEIVNWYCDDWINDVYKGINKFYPLKNHLCNNIGGEPRYDINNEIYTNQEQFISKCRVVNNMCSSLVKRDLAKIRDKTSIRRERLMTFFQDYRQWLEDPFSRNIIHNIIRIIKNDGWLNGPIFLSSTLDYSNIDLSSSTDAPIAIIQQFYIPTDSLRLVEVRQSLALNTANQNINKIILLNERVYTPDELGITNDKIVQVNLGHRMTYKDAMDHAYEHLRGHIVAVTNSDIFFDATIKEISKCACLSKPIVMAQLRYEFNPQRKLANAEIELLRHDCQDAWIWHTDMFYIDPEQRKAFDFPLGKACCDNHVAHLFAYAGAQLINYPSAIKTYHHHASNKRNWIQETPIKRSWLSIAPAGIDEVSSKNAWAFDPYFCQRKLADLLFSHGGMPLLIPRCFGKEMKAAAALVYGKPGECRDILSKICSFRPGNETDMLATVHALLGAIKTCTHRFWVGATSEEVINDRDTYAFIETNFNQPAFDADLCSSVTMAFHKERWTDALTGKKVCLVTKHKAAVQQASSTRVETVGFDAFVDCEISVVDMPDSREGIFSAVDAACKSDVVILDGGVLANEIASLAFASGKWALSMGPQALTLFGLMPKDYSASLLATSDELRPGKEWVVV